MTPEVAARRAFHPLRVAGSRSSPTTPWRSPSRCPTLADGFAFVPGQN